MMNDGTYSTIYDLLFSITKVQSKQLADYLLEQLSSCKYLDNDERTSLEEFKSLVEVTKVMDSIKEEFGADLSNTGIGSTIYAVKPGDGSAREQAASCQKVLGGWANIADRSATWPPRSP